jgi:hypothetical protein
MFLFIQTFTHIFVFMYNYYVINILPTMDFTHSQTMPKPLKIDILILFHNFCFIKLLTFYNKSFSLIKVVSKHPKHPIIYKAK